jgi:MFS family permease
MSLSMPARQAMVPEIVGDDQLVNAIALNSATMNLSRVVGPGIAGAAIALLAGGDTSSHFAVGVLFTTNGVLYVVSIVTLMAIRHQGHSTMLIRGTIRSDMGDGFRYMWNHQLLRGLILMTFIPLLFGFPIQSLMPVFNHDILDGGPDDLGLLLSAMGAGAIVGSFILARIGDTQHKGATLYVSCFLWAIALGGFAVSTTMPLALAAGALMGLVSSIFMSLHMSVVTLIIDPQMRGRVMSIMMMTFGLMPLGALPVSYIAETVGIDIALVFCAFGLAALTALLLITVPGLRRIDTSAVQLAP